MDAPNIPEHLKGEFLQSLEELQVKDQLTLFHRVGEECFRNCVSTFRSKDLSAEENKCINLCATKFLNMSKRVGQRFQEMQMQEQQNLQNQQFMSQQQ